MSLMTCFDVPLKSTSARTANSPPKPVSVDEERGADAVSVLKTIAGREDMTVVLAAAGYDAMIVVLASSINEAVIVIKVGIAEGADTATKVETAAGREGKFVLAAVRRLKS